MEKPVQVSAEHARKNLREILDLAMQGDTVIVMRHSRPAAVIISPRLWDELQALRAKAEGGNDECNTG